MLDKEYVKDQHPPIPPTKKIDNFFLLLWVIEQT